MPRPHAAATTFALLAIVVAGIVALLLLYNWTATATPSHLEEALAKRIISIWAWMHAGSAQNPVPLTPSNLAAGHADFDEHCASCHGYDGSGHNRFMASFYPPIPRLSHGATMWTDAQLYFIIANGIRYTAMPGFGAQHDPDELWRMVLWVRHLPHLTDAERAEVQAKIATAETEHHHEGPIIPGPSSALTPQAQAPARGSTGH